VSPEDFATTLASLEAIARTLGWSEDDDERMPLRHGRGFRHHPGGERRWHGVPGHHGHPHHPGHGHHHGEREHDRDAHEV
jgi:hypothetical protein